MAVEFVEDHDGMAFQPTAISLGIGPLMWTEMTKDMYPKLMDLPDLPLEERAQIKQQAQQRMMDVFVAMGRIEKDMQGYHRGRLSKKLLAEWVPDAFRQNPTGCVRADRRKYR